MAAFSSGATDRDKGVEDDEVSLASTISYVENSDEEWTAEGIIAEGKINGETRWLVDWTGCQIKDATWEPRAHVEGVLLDQWEDTKRMQRRGEAPRFDLSHWRQGWEDELRAKHKRHLRRNEFRISRGIAPTEWDRTLEEKIQQTADYYPKAESRDDESSDSDEVGFGRLDQPSPASKSTQSRSSSNSRQASITSESPQEWEELAKARDNGTNKIPTTQPTNNLLSQNPSSAKIKTTSPAKAAIPAIPTIPAIASTSGLGQAGRKSSTISTANKPNGTAQMLSRLNKKMPPKPTDKPSRPAKESGALATAKRTSQSTTSAAAQNVFIGGSIPKRRASLLDVSSDASREPRLMNYRQQRLMQLRQRDKENNAPVQMPRRLISLDAKSPQETARNKPDEEFEKMDGVTADHESPSASEDVSMPPNIVETVPPKVKKRKSVHWDDRVMYQEPMDINPEPSLFVEDRHQHTSLQNPTARRTNPMEDVIARPPTPPKATTGVNSQSWAGISVQDVTKVCLLGADAPRPMSLVFKNVPQNSPHPKLLHFKTCDKLVFSHYCMAQDFFGQWKLGLQSRQRDLASGFVSCPAERSTLENVADRLRLSSQGLFCCAEEYYVVCFPTKCDEWGFENMPGEDPESPLNFIVFEPGLTLDSSHFASLPNDTEATLHESEVKKALPAGLRGFLNLAYDRLVPPKMKESKTHSIFLAFPSNAKEETSFLAQWLKVSSTAVCEIFTSLTPGEWGVFCQRGKGIIIIHEDARWRVRLFPGMFDILQRMSSKQAYSIFVFQRALGRVDSLPSTLSQTSSMGDLGLRRVFPSKSVFMMTPSFMLSQPLQACAFIKWFKGNYTKAQEQTQENKPRKRGRLAFCADIDEWLLNLWMEQVQKKSVPRRPDIHGKDLKAWEQLWGVVRELIMLSEAEDSDAESLILYGPRVIDGHDEQSLVNWFGFWTLKHLDEASMFYVLGSVSNDRNRMTKHLKLFQYDPKSVDDLAEKPQPENNPSTIQAPTGPRSMVGPKSMMLGQTRANSSSSMVTLIQDDTGSHIELFLKELVRTMPRGSPLLLYHFPMSPWTGDMVWKIDRRLEFRTFAEWLSHLKPFSPGKFAKNTYAGLFYTIGGNWDPSLPADHSNNKKCRPWLAMLRPVRPHKPPWTATELLIWDSSYRGTFDSRESIKEKELIDGQRQLIKQVNSYVSGPDWRMPLKRVWLSWRMSEHSDLVHPLDICLDMLDRFIDDIKYWMPSPEQKMPVRGWKLVLEPNSDSPPPVPASLPAPPGGYNDTAALSDGGSDAMDVDSSSDDDNSSAEVKPPADRIVFHPPLAPKTMSQKNLCNNLLFKTITAHMKQGASSSRRHDKADEEVVLKYTATMIWYGQQQAAGRDFKHIMVDSFIKVFENLGIQDPEPWHWRKGGGH